MLKRDPELDREAARHGEAFCWEKTPDLSRWR